MIYDKHIIYLFLVRNQIAAKKSHSFLQNSLYYKLCTQKNHSFINYSGNIYHSLNYSLSISINIFVSSQQIFPLTKFSSNKYLMIYIHNRDRICFSELKLVFFSEIHKKHQHLQERIHRDLLLRQIQIIIDTLLLNQI